MFKFIPETESNEFLGFKIADNSYCINVLQIQGIIYIPSISKIPNVPNYIEGAINLRGKIIRVINLSKWFKLPWRSYDKNSRIIIIDLDNSVFGILVETIDEVFKISKTDKHDIPGFLENLEEISYLRKIIIQEDRLFLEVNPRKIKE